VQHRPGIGVEDPAAVPAAIIQDRVTVPAVYAVLFLATTRTAQTLRVEQVDQFLVTGIFIHQVQEGEIHEFILEQGQLESFRTPCIQPDS
jgi:hypothetical protein